MIAFRLAGAVSLALLWATAEMALARPNVPDARQDMRLNPNADTTANRALLFGPTAKVTNLNNGRSAVVQVHGRGPRAHDRIMDVSPKVADQLGMKTAGAVPVVIAPIAVSQPDGAVLLVPAQARVVRGQ